MRESLLIHNPAAGQWWRRPSPERVQDYLTARGYKCRLLITRGQDDATALVRDHLADSTDLVWCCGGDGTLGQVATALVETGVPTGVIPTGTVNVVAAEYGIPAHPWRSIDALTGRSKFRPLRVWRADGRAALLGACVGFEARAIGNAGRRFKDWFGIAEVAGQGLVEWSRYRFPELLISGEDPRGTHSEHRSTQLLITNTRRFAGPQVVVPQADPEDDHLDLLIFEGRSRLRLAALWVGVKTPGTLHLKIGGVQHVCARRLYVRSSNADPVEVHINGDAVDRTPVEISPWGEVQLLVPREADDV